MADCSAASLPGLNGSALSVATISSGAASHVLHAPGPAPGTVMRSRILFAADAFSGMATKPYTRLPLNVE